MTVCRNFRRSGMKVNERRKIFHIYANIYNRDWYRLFEAIDRCYTIWLLCSCIFRSYLNDVALIKYHFVRKYLENQFKAFGRKCKCFSIQMTQPMLHENQESTQHTHLFRCCLLFNQFFFQQFARRWSVIEPKIWLHLAIGFDVVRLMVFRNAHQHKISSFVSFDGIRHIIWILLRNNRGTNYTNICSLRWWVFRKV